MKYSDVVKSGLILPKKSKYTVKDADSVMQNSLFKPYKGRTFTPDEAAFIVKASAIHHGTDYSDALNTYGENAIRKNPAPKRKTAARTQRAAVGYVNRPSQITKKAPSKRLKKRRTVNLQSPRGVFPNPRSREGDYESARELFLFISNDGDLYRMRTTHIIDNLAKKKAKGTFDSIKSLTLWKYLADDGAKKYAKDYGGSFDVPTRKMTAVMLADYYAEHIDEEAVKFGPGKTLRKNPVQRGKKFIFVKKAPTNSPNRFSVVAYFHDTPDGAKDAIEYAKAYHRKQPEYIIKVETGVL